MLTVTLQRLEATCVFGVCVCADGYRLTDDQEECVLTSGKANTGHVAILGQFRFSQSGSDTTKLKIYLFTEKRKFIEWL